jgi:AcrR family transcriptional regulator
LTDCTNFVTSFDMSEPLPINDQMAERPPNRQDTVLDAAFHAFATYGYRRTSMDDIARSAGLSRTVLYLHFKNKEDIFRTLAARYFAEAQRDMEAALIKPGQTTEQALLAAFVAKDGKFMDVVLGTPHGGELLDAGMSITKDMLERAEAEKIRILARWLTTLPMADGIGAPEAVARTIIVASMGLKFPGQTIAGYRQAQAQLANLFARAVSR